MNNCILNSNFMILSEKSIACMCVFICVSQKDEHIQKKKKNIYI